MHFVNYHIYCMGAMKNPGRYMVNIYLSWPLHGYYAWYAFQISEVLNFFFTCQCPISINFSETHTHTHTQEKKKKKLWHLSDIFGP
jgi:hypothetical protein